MIPWGTAREDTLLWLLLMACSDWGLDPRDDTAAPRAVVTDTFVQTAMPQVDLLLVVDDTASMAQEQAALADGFGAVVDALDDAGVSWQIGVTSTDMSSSEAGWLRGQPWVVYPDLADPEQAFIEAVDVGTDGASPEAGIAAAQMALTLTGPGEVNAGFRRAEASLHIVFVSDDDDSSDDWLDDPVEDLIALLSGEASEQGVEPLVSAIVGDSPDGCSSESGSARAGERYISLAEATNGVVGSICEADLSELLGALGAASLSYQDTFLLRSTPLADEVNVEIDGVRQVEGWTITALPAVVFEEPPPPGSLIEITYITVVAP